MTLPAATLPAATLPAATFLDGLSGDNGIVAGLAVLVGVALVGLVAGFSKGRVGLLLVGLVAAVVIGLLVIGVPDLAGPREAVAAQLSEAYTLVLPPAVAFVTGWLVARGTWFRRVVVVVVGVAVLLLAAFPYAAAGAATAGALVPGS